jgi:hypothetical protein
VHEKKEGQLVRRLYPILLIPTLLKVSIDGAAFYLDEVRTHYDLNVSSPSRLSASAFVRGVFELRKDLSKDELEPIMAEFPKDPSTRRGSRFGNLFSHHPSHRPVPVGEDDWELQVTIEKACDVIAADSNGLSDPYCKAILLDGAGKALCKAHRTPVLSKTLQPLWHFQLTEFPHQAVQHAASILFEVWDHDVLSKDDFLGECSINVHDIAQHSVGMAQSFRFVKLHFHAKSICRFS